ncbi:MAG: RNA polymerase sigma factor [Candidatus Krumholzibacteriota bacterium]|nr:RNA polymerase sigma factor [Candidatus Krumholzibacteriota bacterium]
MKGADDNELVKKSLNGSERAFRAIIEKHAPVVYSAVRSVIGNSDDIDDLVQDIFIKIYRGLSRFRGDSRLSTWIYTIARNESFNARGKKRPETVPVDTIDLSGPSNQRPDRVFLARQDSAEIRGLIARLDGKYREVIELRYLAEKSYIEISEIMEIPIGTVKTYLHRARNELKDMFSHQSEYDRRRDRNG